MLTRKNRVVATVVTTLLSAFASAQLCAPPPNFVDTPHPAIVPVQQLVTHTEEITIARPLTVVLTAVDKPLKDTFKKSDTLPTVSGEYQLTERAFGTAGSRRLTCLTDGSTLEEEVLQSDRDSRSHRFRYVVWNYTTEKARPIEYAIGDFQYLQLDGGTTHITWTYSFKLKEHNFPGNFGAVGRWLFRKYFLEREYADLMRGVLNGYKADAEQNGDKSMDYSVPAYLTPFMLTGMIIVITALLLGLRRALRRATWPETDRAKALWTVSSLLVGWFVVAVVTSIAGFYRPPSGKPPTIQYGLLV